MRRLIHATVLRDCINMHDNTSHYDCLTYVLVVQIKLLLLKNKVLTLQISLLYYTHTWMVRHNLVIAFLVIPIEVIFTGV